MNDDSPVLCAGGVLMLALGCAATPAQTSLAPAASATSALDCPRVVFSNDYWDAVEQPSLFYFCTAEVLRALGENCPTTAAAAQGPDREMAFVPWLQQVCRTPGDHHFPGEGGLADPAAIMTMLRLNKLEGLVCCGHRSYPEVDVPDHFQLRRDAAGW
ncbi:MAG: hypothetical protein ABIJ09_24165, partial [Pseudomonadota bacterium]